MSTLNKETDRWTLKSTLIIGLVSILIGFLCMVILSGRLNINLHSLVINSGYSLMIGYGLFANGWVYSLFEDQWISWTERPFKSFFIAFSIMTAYSSVIIFFTNWFWYVLLMGVEWSEFWRYGKNIILLEYGVLYFLTQFFYAKAFLDEWRKSALVEEQLKRKAVSLQYKVLSNQVNPHFLFNSLNVLSSLIKIDQDRAENYVNKLSLFYRDLLSFRGQDIISLKDEISYVSKYLDLQKERFGDNIKVDISFNDGENLMLIPMTVQMLVENAIKHNQINKEHHLEIVIDKTDEGYLLVKNNIKPYLNPADGEKLGLKNLMERYNMLSDLPMQVENTGEFFTVKVPLLTIEN